MYFSVALPDTGWGVHNIPNREVCQKLDVPAGESEVQHEVSKTWVTPDSHKIPNLVEDAGQGLPAVAWKGGQDGAAGINSRIQVRLLICLISSASSAGLRLSTAEGV